MAGTSDPTDDIEFGTPGASAPARYERLRGRDDQRRRHRNREHVIRRVPREVPVRAVLCFTGVEWPFFARPFDLDGVRVTWPKALAKALLAPGQLDAEARGELTRTLSNSFPAYTGGRRASPG